MVCFLIEGRSDDFIIHPQMTQIYADKKHFVRLVSALIRGI